MEEQRPGSGVPATTPDAGAHPPAGAPAIPRARLAADALAHTLEAIVIFDADLRIVFVNRAFTRITGYSAAEVIGATPESLYAGAHDADVYQTMLSTLKATGQWRGELWKRRKSGETFPALLSFAAVRGERGETTHYIHVFNDISRYKDYERQLAFLAHRDPVTHLPNRTLFEHRCDHALASARRHGKGVGILFIDLDHFKAVNDSLGHHMGDLLLQLVAERLTAGVRETDTVARFGGDEFVVLLEDLTDADVAARIAGKLLRALEAPFICADHPVHIAASIGFSCYPDDGRDAGTLLRRADAAMYEAKRSGRRRYRSFAARGGRAGHAVQLTGALHDALEQDALTLSYRPVAHLADGGLAAVQAIARWRHRQFGHIGAHRLARIAEEANLVTQVDTWMLSAACDQLRRWQDGPTAPRLLLALSARTLHDPDLVTRLRDAISRTGVDAGAITLQVPESALTNEASAPAVLKALRSLGPALAIGQFGSGYSCLKSLATLPLEALHIDPAFMRGRSLDPSQARVIGGAIAVARSLGLTTMVAGVATEEQRQFLLAQGCDHGQGRLFGGLLSTRAVSRRARMQAQSGAGS